MRQAENREWLTLIHLLQASYFLGVGTCIILLGCGVVCAGAVIAKLKGRKKYAYPC